MSKPLTAYPIHVLIAAVLLLASCNSQVDHKDQAEPLRLLAKFHLGEGVNLPFHIELYKDSAVIINADERVRTVNLSRQGDSLFMEMPVHRTEIRAIQVEDQVTGYFYDYSRSAGYKIPISAKTGDFPRFPSGGKEEEVAALDWKVTFPGNEPDDKPGYAIGKIQADQGKLKATMLTPTGDYRFLEGRATEDSVFLSCFDGAHAFLFKALRLEDGSLTGTFWSGTHWQEPWTAHRDSSFVLPDPNSLTYVADGEVGNDVLPNFCFNTVKGQEYCLDEANGKVRIIQILGSWCPNCRDETVFYEQVYKDYADRGLEIISLAFERGDTEEQWRKGAGKMVKDLQIEWPVLLAGKASKSYASSLFPNLNSVSSFPTSIFVDRKGKIHKIHTGFNGPATGDEYTKFKAEFHATINELL
ncbi:MAG: thiol-disulfide isomerase/thioredoxin [Limisphaerales bacterium]|jgi:thiol-disulfide isomerase/thioredoxin